MRFFLGSSCESVHFEGQGRPAKRLERLAPGERRRSARCLLFEDIFKGLRWRDLSYALLHLSSRRLFRPAALRARRPAGFDLQRLLPLFWGAPAASDHLLRHCSPVRILNVHKVRLRYDRLAFLESDPTAPGRGFLRFASKANPSTALYRFWRRASSYSREIAEHPFIIQPSAFMFYPSDATLIRGPEQRCWTSRKS